MQVSDLLLTACACCPSAGRRWANGVVLSLLADHLLPCMPPKLADGMRSRLALCTSTALPLLSPFLVFPHPCADGMRSQKRTLLISTAQLLPLRLLHKCSFPLFVSLQTACAARSGLALRISTASNQLTHQACLDSVD